jgi:hypothetical protein
MAVSAPDHYEVRWRQTGTVQWGEVSTIKPTDEIVVEGLDRAKTYDFEVRAVAACGAKSAWVTGSHAPASNPVPLTITSITASSLADGVHLAWTIASNAPAGIEYSVERSANGTTGWTARTSVRALAYTDPETSGTVYYYRVQAIAFGGTTGPYSSVVNSAGTNVGAIATAATQAVTLATSMAVINGGFEALPAGYGWTADGGTGWYTDTTSGTPGVPPNGARRNAGTGSNTGAYMNNGVIGCQPGQVVKAQALFKCVGITGGCFVLVQWLDASLATLGTSNGNQITGTVTNGSYVVGVAPAGTVYAKVGLYYNVMTAGTVYADNVVCTQQPSNQSEVPNGGGHNSVTGIDGSGLALIDFTQGHFSKNLDNVADTGTRFAAAQAGADKTSSNTASDTAHVNGATAAAISDGAGRAQAGFDSSGYLVTGRNTLDKIADSGTYGRFKLASMTGNDYDFSKGGVNRQLGYVPDGGGRYGVHQVDSNNLAIIDFTQAGHVSKNLDNVADTGTYSRVKTSQVAGGVVSLLNSGRNAIFNGTFVANNNGVINSSAVLSGNLYDGWSGYGGTANVSICIPYNATIRTRTYGPGYVVPTTGGFGTGAQMFSQMFTVQPSRPYVLNVNRFGGSSGALPSGVSFYALIFISFYDYAGAFISNSAFWDGNIVTASSTVNGQFAYTGTAPAGATKGALYNYMYCTNAGAPVALTNGTYFDCGINSVEFMQAAEMDNEVTHGVTYGKPANADLYDSGGVRRVGLRIAGSGQVLGNQYNAPNSLTMTYGAAQSTTSLSATSAGAVSVAAFIVYTGSVSASYSAVSNAVTGLTVGSSYHIYCHDAGGAGGTKTWYAAASVQLAMQQGDDVVFAGKITIPASGTSGGGGTGCPVREAWVIRKTPDGREYCHAGDVQIGDELLLADMRWGYVSHSQAELQPCVRVVGECGKSLSCSESAPLGLIGGGSVLAPDSAGEVIRTKRDGGESDCIDRIEYIGRQWVQHITCEDDYFWTGDEQDCLFSHHNMKPP